MTELAHTPYDGSRKPFTIGLSPLDPAAWIEVGPELPQALREKRRLFATDRDAVFRAEAGTEAAQAEALDLLLAHLRAVHMRTHAFVGEAVHVVEDAAPVQIDGGEPTLLTAARLVADDLVLMRRDAGSWRLVAAALCFPSSWSLADKFGGSLDQIHAPVPGYAEQLAVRMARIFDNLKPDIPAFRLNWSIYPDADLRHAEPKQPPGSWFERPEDLAAAAFIRVERQTLRKLPISGDILFTIRILVDPLEALRRHADGTRLAAALAAQVAALDERQLAYKALTLHRDRLIAALEGIARTG